MKKRWHKTGQLTEEQNLLKTHISSELKCPEIVAEILIRKGITDIQEIESFFNPSIEDVHDPKSYIFNVLRSRIVDFYRSKKNRVESVSDLSELPELPDFSYFEDQRVYARLYKALESLPEQRKRIVKLAVYDSLTYDQIASKLGISKNTVKSQIKNAYRTLRDVLDIKDFVLTFILTR